MSRLVGMHITCTLGLYNASCEVWRLPRLEDVFRDLKKCVKLRAAREGFQVGLLGSGKPFSDGLLIAAEDCPALLRHQQAPNALDAPIGSSAPVALSHQTKVCASERLKSKSKGSGTGDPSKNSEEAEAAKGAETLKVIECDGKRQS